MTRQKMMKDMRKEQFKATKELFYSSVIGWIKCFSVINMWEGVRISDYEL